MTNIMDETVQIWLFSKNFSDGFPKDGVEYSTQEILFGFHILSNPLDALYHASGDTINRVELKLSKDKIAQKCKILWRVDGENVFRIFARMCALDFIDLWNPPDVVMDYLITGDEDLRPQVWSQVWNVIKKEKLEKSAKTAALASIWAADESARIAAMWAALYADETNVLFNLRKSSREPEYYRNYMARRLLVLIYEAKRGNKH